jgi:capsular polysaccharide transport system permease protein
MTDVSRAAPPVRPPVRSPGLRPAPRRRFASLRAITALMMREMVTTYGRSPGGYLWAVLEPVGGIALLTAIFSVGFRSPSIGISFPLFYATGMLPFLFYNDVQMKVAMAVTFSRNLLSYPSVTFVDALVARFLMGAITQLLVGYLVMGGILLMFETRASIDFGQVAAAYGMASLLALGIGSFNAYLFAIFPIWRRAWSILMRPMFLISCIFFLFDTIPQPMRDWLWWNPIVHIVGMMRAAFYPTYDAYYVMPSYVVAISLVTLLLGLVFLSRYHRTILND